MYPCLSAYGAVFGDDAMPRGPRGALRAAMPCRRRGTKTTTCLAVAAGPAGRAPPPRRRRRRGLGGAARQPDSLNWLTPPATARCCHTALTHTHARACAASSRGPSVKQQQHLCSWRERARRALPSLAKGRASPGTPRPARHQQHTIAGSTWQRGQAALAGTLGAGRGHATPCHSAGIDKAQHCGKRTSRDWLAVCPIPSPARAVLAPCWVIPQTGHGAPKPITAGI